jgi:hypothetical protein
MIQLAYLTEDGFVLLGSTLIAHGSSEAVPFQIGWCCTEEGRKSATELYLRLIPPA